MAIWLHPSVTSTIVDNSGFYATADGVTTLFAPGFFQKGKDNELIAVEGPTDADLVRKFGSIDAVEYGQTHLNLVNWLTAGGSAVVMRCLPDNAKYAHAILEVLTKKVIVSGDIITIDGVRYNLYRDYDVDGNFIGIVYYNEDDEKVLVCDAESADEVLSGNSNSDLLLVDGAITLNVEREVVNVVPKIVYVPSGVSKKEVIEAYISNKNGQKNSDGYVRHILGYFIPEGRGASYYNDVRISITLASNYDSTYDFRVYSIQFEKYDSLNEEWGVIYGPYYVSFDETARDFSNETMFIADILDKYCSEFTFIPFGANSDEESGMFNKGFYDAAKAIAGSNANLRRVDVLSCKEVFSEAENSFSHFHKDTIVNGGTLNLRQNININDTALYVEGALPIKGSDIIIANSISRTVQDVNITEGKVSVTKAFNTKAYTEDEIAALPEEEQEAAKKVSVDASVNGIIYVNDIKEPISKATVKLLDNAIEKITSKKFRVYLNKNGADFAAGDDIKINVGIIQKYGKVNDTSDVLVITSVDDESLGLTVGQEFVKNDYDYVNGNLAFRYASESGSTPGHWDLIDISDPTSPVVLASSLACLTITEISSTNTNITSNLQVNDKFYLTPEGIYQKGQYSFIYKATEEVTSTENDQQVTTTVPAHWALVKAGQENEIASSSNNSETLLNATFSDFTFEITNLTNGASSLSDTASINPAFGRFSYNFYESDKSYERVVSDGIIFQAKIAEVDQIDDAIVIDFTGITQGDVAANNFISAFDDLDYTSDVTDPTTDSVSGGSDDALISVEAIEKPVSPYAKCLSLSEGDYAYMLYGSAGDVDTADGATRAQVATTRNNLLIKAFRGTLNPAITMKKLWPIDIVLDANYEVPVKNAINELTLSREDFMFICDTGFCATPEQAIEKRNNALVYNNRYTAIFTQDMRVYDEYSSKNIKVTPTYFLAKKIPYVDRAYGIHYAFVGPNRGEVEGMVEGTLSWNPTEAQKEKLYKKQLNYIQHDPNHLMFMGQLTSQKRATSLSDIPNVRALLMIRRNIEAICEEYYFERINDNLLSVMSNACNTYLGQWVSNGTLSEGNVSVYASEYDMKQKLVRVQVELKFTSFLERIVITFTVK